MYFFFFFHSECTCGEKKYQKSKTINTWLIRLTTPDQNPEPIPVDNIYHDNLNRAGDDEDTHLRYSCRLEARTGKEKERKTFIKQHADSYWPLHVVTMQGIKTSHASDLS